ncbi:DNA primase [Lachnospiraceae bacterium MD1]|uniref:DNA primase n=1 Tax=Variimorphobacter saccharofermentans TaxID=2755051 RepID=A0A839JX23_9FIRM|nr:DNA primase [Variimorphobacter saccharofermentans]MBB2181946.1 DNA primase [Variimorphobacter saccharofermentans]
MFYSDELVEEIRSKNDIVSVIGSYIRLQKKGSNHMGLCPFHNEKTPSFSVSPTKQMYHCFGCGVGGNVFTFIMEYENFTFVEALKFLAERAGVALPEREYSEEAKRQSDMRARLLEVNKQAAKYFYYQLISPRGQAAHDYLVQRGLTEETIKQFGLGYSNKYSDDLYKYLKGQGYEDEFLKTSGLVTIDERKGATDKFWNRVMFPIMDANHRVIGFGGRVMGDGMPKYVNSPETLIFDKSRNLYGLNFARASRKQYLLICEGYMDVIALHQAGFTNAVAALGTAFTIFHANLLKRYTNEVLLTFDSDSAGTQAALRAIPILKEAGLTVKVINMKPYKDPDEFIKALGAEEYAKRIAEARNSFFFEIDVLQSEYDMADPEQKTKFFHETAKKLLGFTEELERNFYLDAVAKNYQIDVEQLRKVVNKLGSQIVVGLGEPREYHTDANRGKKTTEDGISKSQKLLLTWLIEDNTLFDKVAEIIGPEDFTEGIYHEVAVQVFDQYEKEKTVNPAKIINCFQSKEEQSEAAALFSAGIRGEMDDAGWQKALSDTIMRIKENSLDMKSQKAIEANDTELLMRIIAEKTQLKKHKFSFHN